MTGEQFKKLVDGSEIMMEGGKTFRVEDTDHFGRVKLQKMEYYIDVWEYHDEYFETYDEAINRSSDIEHELEDDLKDLNEFLSDLDDDDEQKEETQSEIDQKEELLDQIKCCDIEEEECGKPFWMHYKDINDEEVTYSVSYE